MGVNLKTEKKINVAPSNAEICRVIVKMGADSVGVTRDSGTLYVIFHRHGGCGRIYVNVCTFLAKRFPDNEIVVLESPRKNAWCKKARVRKPGGTHFVKMEVLVTETVLATETVLDG
jgi:hypothetical protein